MYRHYRVPSWAYPIYSLCTAHVKFECDCWISKLKIKLCETVLFRGGNTSYTSIGVPEIERKGYLIMLWINRFTTYCTSTLGKCYKATYGTTIGKGIITNSVFRQHLTSLVPVGIAPELPTRREMVSRDNPAAARQEMLNNFSNNASMG